MRSDLPARRLRPSLPSAVLLHDYGIYFALAVLVVFFSARIPEFRTWDNALLVLLQVSVIGIIAVGMTFAPEGSRRVGGPDALGDLGAAVALDRGDLVLALEVEPELRPVAELARTSS